MGFLAGPFVVLEHGDTPDARLAEWLDDPNESGLFTRRDIADLALILEQRKEDVRLVWNAVQAQSASPGLSPGLEKALNALYTHFYLRILRSEKDGN